MLARFAVPAATVALLGAAVSTASAALTAPQTISPVGQSASYPFASTNADGDAAVQWDAYTEGLQVSMRPARGSWDAAPAQLTAPGARVAGRQVVIDSTGAATAIWGEYTTTIVGGFPTNGPVTIFTARRPAGGAWGAPEQLSTPSVNAGYLSVLAVGSDDELVALWDEGGALHSATRSPSGAWSASASVPSASTNQTPRVAMDASGTATAAWQDASTDHVMSSTLAPGGAWTTPVDVSGVPGFVPALAMNEDGDATLVWNGGSTSQMSSRRPTTASAWSAPTQISVNGGLNYYTPSVAVDADGRATAAWSQANLVGGNVRYDQMVASRAGDGTWGAPVSLDTGSSDSLAISAEAGGEVTVAWRGLDAQSNLVAQTATRAPGGRGRRRQTSPTSATPTPTSASTATGMRCSSLRARASSRRQTTVRDPGCATCPSPPQPRSASPRASPSPRSTRGHRWRRPPGTSATAPPRRARRRPTPTRPRAPRPSPSPQPMR